MVKGENMRFIVFECRKCGHHLYVENTEDVVKAIGRVSNLDCPIVVKNPMVIGC